MPARFDLSTRRPPAWRARSASLPCSRSRRALRSGFLSRRELEPAARHGALERSAELSVYLKEDITESSWTRSRRRSTERPGGRAAARVQGGCRGSFPTGLPDLSARRTNSAPIPSCIADVRLKSESRETGEAVDAPPRVSRQRQASRTCATTASCWQDSSGDPRRTRRRALIVTPRHRCGADRGQRRPAGGARQARRDRDHAAGRRRWPRQRTLRGRGRSQGGRRPVRSPALWILFLIGRARFGQVASEASDWRLCRSCHFSSGFCWWPGACSSAVSAVHRRPGSMTIP